MNKKGFTLIELLIVIAIIAILMAVVFVALNPLRLFAESRNAQRWVKVSELLHAVHLYAVQHDGEIPNINSWQEDTYYVLGTSVSGCTSSCGAKATVSSCLNLTDLVTEKYIPELPRDPKDGEVGNTDIYAYRTEGTIISVGICDPELGEVIELTR